MTHKCTCGENHNPPSGTINYTAKTEAREASFALGLQGKKRGDPNFKIPAYKTLDKMKGKKEYYDTIFSHRREEHKEREEMMRDRGYLAIGLMEVHSGGVEEAIMQG